MARLTITSVFFFVSSAGFSPDPAPPHFKTSLPLRPFYFSACGVYKKVPNWVFPLTKLAAFPFEPKHGPQQQRTTFL